MYRRTETNNYFVVFLSSPQNQPKGLFHHFCQKLDLDIYLKITEKSNTNQLKQFQGFDIISYYCYLLLFLLEFENLELIVDLSFIKNVFVYRQAKRFTHFMISFRINFISVICKDCIHIRTYIIAIIFSLANL